MNLKDHPSVVRYFEKKNGSTPAERPEPLDSEWVRQTVLDAGADDAGLASIDSPVLATYRSKVLTVFPEAKTCISVICRMNRENVRGPFRQQYELEYHHMFTEASRVARRAAVRFAERGIRAIDCSSSYPINMENFPNMDMWHIRHKPIAVAAGMGGMGLHHLVVHEGFGCFIALSSVLPDRDVTEYARPLD
jgi:epoxyqueuosine reductase QueG